MLCYLCGKRGNFPDGFCQECQTLIYRNNDKLEYIKVLRKVLELNSVPLKLREEIEEMIKHVPPFDAGKEL